MLTLPANNTSAASAAVAGQANGSNRILFLVVVSGADVDCLEEPKPAGPRYTRDSLRNLLQLLGCKPRLAYKIMLAVFQAVDQAVITARQQRTSRKTFQVHPHRNGKVYVSLTRADFMLLVSTCAAQYSYKISPSSDELKVACSLRERRRCVVVLLSGTSGSGKSTLASILATRLGITTVISTDSIRHMLRSFHSKESSPLLWASTYQAGEAINPDKGAEVLSSGELAVSGYKAQCELLAEQLEVLIAGCEARQESLICEGVHLSISTVLKLMSRHPDVLPFLVHIGSEHKHVERMAVRAKYMTLDPRRNRYVRYMGNIRLIQEYLVRKADKHLIPHVENSNVDRSVGIIHLTVMGCLRRMSKGEPVLDPSSGKAVMLSAEYASVLDHLEGEKDRVAAKVASSSSSSAAAAGPLPNSWDPGASSSSSRQQSGTSAAASSSKSKHRISGPADHTLMTAAIAADGSSSSSLATGSRRSIDLSMQAPAAAAVAGSASKCSSSDAPVSSQQQSTLQLAAAVSEASQQLGAQHQAAVLVTAATADAGGRPVTTPDAVAAVRPDAAGASAVGVVVIDSDVCRMSAEGPVMKWEKFITAARLSPGDDAVLSASPSSPLAAAGLAMAWPHGSGNLGLTQQQQQQQQIADATAATVIAGSSRVAAARVSSSSSEQHEVDQQQQTHSDDDEEDEAKLVSAALCGGSSSESSRVLAGADDADVDESVDGAISEADNIFSPSSSTRCDSRSNSRQQQQQGSFQMDPELCDGLTAVEAAALTDDDADAGHSQDEVEGYAAFKKVAQLPADRTFDVSSGEELDELAELCSNSSDAEGEMFLTEYGSMAESTTCDEHDDDEHELMGHVGLRAWNAGMARALWPSYHHVYNTNSSSSGALAPEVMRGMPSADHHQATGGGNTAVGGRNVDHGGLESGARGLSRSSLGPVAEHAPVVVDAGDAAPAAAATESGSSGLPPLHRYSSSGLPIANVVGLNPLLFRRSRSGGHGRSGVGSRGHTSRQHRRWLSGTGEAAAADGPSHQQQQHLSGPSGQVDGGVASAHNGSDDVPPQQQQQLSGLRGTAEGGVASAHSSNDDPKQRQQQQQGYTRSEQQDQMTSHFELQQQEQQPSDPQPHLTKHQQLE